MRCLIQKLKKIIFNNKCSMCRNILSNDEEYICQSCFAYLKENCFLKNSGNYFYLYYYNENIRRLITDYKLKNRKGIGELLGKIVGVKIEELIKEKSIDCIIPVPLSNKRIKERGFDQIEELLKNTSIAFTKIKRVKDTKHMYNLKNESERVENIKGVFKIEENLTGKKILIVDDIITTGATIYEVIKEIRTNYEVEKIYVFSIAVVQKFLKKG